MRHLKLKKRDCENMEEGARSEKGPNRVFERALGLLSKGAGVSLAGIAKDLKVYRVMIQAWREVYKELG